MAKNNLPDLPIVSVGRANVRYWLSCQFQAFLLNGLGFAKF